MNILTHAKFWDILERSGSINESRGMKRVDFKTSSASLTSFTKTHSYGEYIFDWAWAEAYERYGIAYYPKLTSMVPFTPATAAHFHGETSHWATLLAQHDIALKNHSSAHFLFTTPEEQIFLGESGYFLRDSFQYHFFNQGYKTFDDFLISLKNKKAKNIKLERDHTDLKIEKITGNHLTQNHADEMYGFYLMTLQEKKAIAYLTQDFFRLLFQELPSNTLYIRASKNDALMAGALFYYDEKRIYGRYWGANTYIPNLHFELCYYQGIEFCIEHGLEVFEAGAQGEHKISRGFRPVLTASAHKFNHQGFSKLIGDYIKNEKPQIADTMYELSKLLPFKNERI